MDDLTSQKLLEDSSDFVNEFSDNLKEYKPTNKPVKGKQGNIFLVIFSYLSTIFALIVIFTNVFPIKTIWGLIACIISLILGYHFFFDKTKNNEYTFNSITRYLGLVLIITSVIVAIIERYTTN